MSERENVQLPPEGFSSALSRDSNQNMVYSVNAIVKQFLLIVKWLKIPFNNTPLSSPPRILWLTLSAGCIFLMVTFLMIPFTYSDYLLQDKPGFPHQVNIPSHGYLSFSTDTSFYSTHVHLYVWILHPTLLISLSVHMYFILLYRTSFFLLNFIQLYWFFILLH